MQSLIFDDEQETKIYKPKVRRLFPMKRRNKQKASSSNKNIYIYFWDNCDSYEQEKSLFLKNINLEEIKRDFNRLSQKLEEEQCYNEIMEILFISNSKKDTNKNRINIASKENKKEEN